MAAVLAGTVTVQCSHGNQIQVTSGQNKLKIGSDSVLVAADLLGVVITTCTGNPQCGAITTILTGLAAKLRVGIQAVALEGAGGATATAAWQVKTAGRNELEAA